MRISPVGLNLLQSYKNTFAKRQVLPSMPCDSVHFSGKKQNDEQKIIVIMLGAPNSGKGTCAREISKQYNIPQISTGDILRNEVKNQTPLGLEAKSYMDAGLLVPDETIIGIFKNRVAQDDCKNGYILDGFPRTIEQAQKLQEVLDEDKNAKLKIINLDVSENILYERSANRYMCQDCSKTVSIKEGYDPETSKCECGGSLIKRADDTPEVLSQRLEKYNEQTLPLLDFYNSKVQNVEIKGEDTPLDYVLNSVFEVLENEGC